MAIVKKISELTPKGSALSNTDLLVVGVDNGTDYDLKSVTGAQILGNVISQTITDGDTTHSPSSNVVFDSLALKVDKVTGSRLITSSESTLLGNTSGTNTGDETVTTIKTKLGITTLSGSNTGDQDLSSYATNSTVVKLTGDQTVGGIKTLTNELKLNDKLYLSETATPAATTGYTTLTSNGSQFVLQNGASTAAATFVFSGARTYTLPSATGTIATTTDLTSKVEGNTAITGATKTKITYDSKGLVTSGADATTADIADSLNKRYVTDANLTTIGNTSGTNTGDQTFINARVQSVTSSATVTPVSTNDEVIITAQAVGLTLANPTGTFTEGQAFIVRIKDNGTAQSIAYGTNYRGTTLPTTTTVGTTTYIPFIYNSTDGKFDNLSASGITTTIPTVIQLACSDETTALTVGTSKVTFRMPHAMTLTSVRASLNVAGTTSGITTIDINEGGVSILSTKLTIDLNEKTSTTSATPSVISDSSLADDAEITIDIDAISGGATEKGLKITLIGTRMI